jgi:hypothetical protein
VYTVFFTARARDELAQTWLSADASMRARITAASDELERNLRFRPNDIGESRDQGRRIAFSGPLGMIFRVHEADRKVVVLHVWRHVR